MINSKELRIGNSVLYTNQFPDRITGNTNEILEVKGPREFGVDLGYIGYTCFNVSFEYIDPIKLSEGWLLKLGFKDMGEFYDDVDKSYCLNDKWYIIFVDGVYKFGLEYQDFCTELKNVHQLQNIYFALTGEELEIKL